MKLRITNFLFIALLLSGCSGVPRRNPQPASASFLSPAPATSPSNRGASPSMAATAVAAPAYLGFTVNGQDVGMTRPYDWGKPFHDATGRHWMSFNGYGDPEQGLLTWTGNGSDIEAHPCPVGWFTRPADGIVGDKLIHSDLDPTRGVVTKTIRLSDFTVLFEHVQGVPWKTEMGSGIGTPMGGWVSVAKLVPDTVAPLKFDVGYRFPDLPPSPGVAVIGEQWTNITVQFDNCNGKQPSHVSSCLDHLGRVWVFSTSDSTHGVNVAVLEETSNGIALVAKLPDFLSCSGNMPPGRDGPLGPDGEFPQVNAVRDGNKLLLIYAGCTGKIGTSCGGLCLPVIAEVDSVAMTRTLHTVVPYRQPQTMISCVFPGAYWWTGDMPSNLPCGGVSRFGLGQNTILTNATWMRLIQSCDDGWLAGEDQTGFVLRSLPLGPVLTITQTAKNQVRVSWTGTGTLQESTDLKTWTDSAISQNPATFTITGQRRFWRVR